MFHPNHRRVPTRRSRDFPASQRGYSSSDRDFFDLMPAMSRELFERSLDPRADLWDWFDRSPAEFYEPVLHYQRPVEPVHSSYERKIITTDDSGRVMVETQRRLPGGSWQRHVEEYVDGNRLEQNSRPPAIRQGQSQSQSQQAKTSTQNNKPEDSAQQQQQQQQQTIKQPGEEAKGAADTAQSSQNTAKQTSSSHSDTSPATNILNLFDQHFHELSDTFMHDFDHFFGIRHPFFNRHPRLLQPEVDMLDIDDNNTTYEARTLINDNGHVTVKTVSKQPGSEWKTSVKHYGRNGALEGSQQQTEAIGNSNANVQKTSPIGNANANEQKTSEKEQNSDKNENSSKNEQADDVEHVVL